MRGHTMLKVLIVDDDFVMRSNLRAIVDWEQYGFEICGEATNGKNAIQLIEELLPAIVITDMSMPVMNGVDLIKYIKSAWPEIKVIGLSGYQDFEYVKESLKNGALDYLLKHKLDKQNLLAVLKLAVEKIKQDNTFKQQFVESTKILRRNFLRSLLLGEIQEENEIEKNVKKLQIPLGEKNFLVTVFLIDEFSVIKEQKTKKEQQKLCESVYDLTVDILQDMDNGIVVETGDGTFAIIFSFESTHSQNLIANHVNTTVRRILGSIKRYLNITACFSMGKIFSKLEDIPQVYKKNNEILKRNFSEKGKVFNDEIEKETKMVFFNLDIKDEKQIILFLRLGNMVELEKYINGLFAKLICMKINYKGLQMMCAELIGIANRLARNEDIDITDLYTNKNIPYEEMQKQETIVNVKHWILAIYQRLITLLMSGEIKNDYNELTKKMIKYIRENYNKDISLCQTAEYIGGNSTYLSRIFKEDCGIGFAEYLNQIRVGQAKCLIEQTDTRLKEIVKQVGFNNYTYFFKVFKGIEGVTPVEYKEKCKQDKGDADCLGIEKKALCR